MVEEAVVFSPRVLPSWSTNDAEMAPAIGKAVVKGNGESKKEGFVLQ